jgi:hypothetical protein
MHGRKMLKLCFECVSEELNLLLVITNNNLQHLEVDGSYVMRLEGEYLWFIIVYNGWR